MDTPYLSFCVHSRNDNHGGNMYRRMKTCLFGFFEQAERHKVHSEIVLVDWNPPRNKPLLKDAYPWPKQAQYCTIRIVVVTPEIHRRYSDWKKLPVHNCVAPNVATRHAKGKFILASTIDVLLSDELFSFLASGKLKENTLYRTSQYNVKRQVSYLRSLDEQLNYCAENIIQCRKFDPKTTSSINFIESLSTGEPGTFLLLDKENWHRIRGFPELNLIGWGCDTLFCYKAFALGIKIEGLPDVMKLYHIDHDKKTTMGYPPKIRSILSQLWKKSGVKKALPPLFVKKLQKLGQKLWPARNSKIFSKVPYLNEQEKKLLYEKIISSGGSITLNDESWGLGLENLQEFVVVKKKDQSACMRIENQS